MCCYRSIISVPVLSGRGYVTCMRYETSYRHGGNRTEFRIPIGTVNGRRTSVGLVSDRSLHKITIENISLSTLVQALQLVVLADGL